MRALLAAAAAGVSFAWMASWVFPEHLDGSSFLAGFAAAAAAGASSWRRLARREATPSTLRWDGTAWSVRPAPGATAIPGVAALVLDLGGWMLVRFRAAGPSRGRGRTIWLPLRASADPARWCMLRAALWTWRAEPSPGVR